MTHRKSSQRSATRANFSLNSFFRHPLLIWLILTVSYGALMNYTNVKEQEVQVIEFENRRSDDSAEVRLIHTDSGVFMNSDTLFWLKFNSSDIQTNLILAKQSGKKVRIKTVGFRIPLFSQYPNILETH
jgi:Protein of unknown function (DUF1523)